MISVYIKESNSNWFGIAYSEESIVAASLGSDEASALRTLQKSLPSRVHHQIVKKGSEFAEKTILEMEKVHYGIQEFKDLVLSTEYLSKSLSKVLMVAASIPIGYVTSYGNIAKIVRTNPRTVGQIMASNPLYPIVQCHRVVGSDFSLVGYGGTKSPQALKVKLDRLGRECKGFKSEKDIKVDGELLRVYPTEYVLKKAERQGLVLSRRQQDNLAKYV